ncbi:DUF4139 domain-containing protein [Chitinophaga vietnamensis]|uniref:DUF4139 domain-containing protein n=1 Tax=Chitinophaga vietnamensis TaxID=2593957 RepID=UPI00137558FB|nr:DUF4139 domain-containing protein [Chitinophaga vietnamensis]
MKQLPLLIMLAFLQPLVAQNKRQTAVSSISKVTVFLHGAQVTRTANITLIPGNNQVLISGISPDVDTKSIQVKGDGKFTLLAVSHQPNIIRQQTQREEITALDAQREKLEDKLDREKNNAQVYTQEQTMLSKNQVIAGTSNGTKAADLKEALDLQRSRLSEVLDKLFTINRNTKSLEKELELVNSQLAALRNQKDLPTSDIILDILAKENTSGKFTISYLVRNAGWIPAYDLRVKDITQPLLLTYKASVYQQCGEDWKNIKLTLSTGNPGEGNVKPSLQPWYLRTYYSLQELNSARRSITDNHPGEIAGIVTDNDGQPLPGCSVQLQGRTIGTITDDKGMFRLQSPGGPQIVVFSAIGFNSREMPASTNMSVSMLPSTKTLEEVVVTGYAGDGLTGRAAGISISSAKKVKSSTIIPDVTEQYTPTTFYFDIPVPYTIPPDGKPYAVSVKELEIPASYQYYAVPKLDKSAFLMAGITDWEQLNLLEGEASIYFEDTYLGKSVLDLQSGKDTLQISLGRDKQVVINRTLQKENSKKHFMAKDQTITRAWELSVKNNKAVPISIILQDQLPIKVSSDMDVSRTEYDGAQLDENTRLLSWQLNVAPAQEQKKYLKYAISYPKGVLVNVE